MKRRKKSSDKSLSQLFWGVSGDCVSSQRDNLKVERSRQRLCHKNESWRLQAELFMERSGPADVTSAKGLRFPWKLLLGWRNPEERFKQFKEFSTQFPLSFSWLHCRVQHKLLITTSDVCNNPQSHIILALTPPGEVFQTVCSARKKKIAKRNRRSKRFVISLAGLWKTVKRAGEWASRMSSAAK